MVVIIALVHIVTLITQAKLKKTVVKGNATRYEEDEQNQAVSQVLYKFCAREKLICAEIFLLS